MFKWTVVLYFGLNYSQIFLPICIFEVITFIQWSKIRFISNKYRFCIARCFFNLQIKKREDNFRIEKKKRHKNQKFVFVKKNYRLLATFAWDLNYGNLYVFMLRKITTLSSMCFSFLNFSVFNALWLLSVIGYQNEICVFLLG